MHHPNLVISVEKILLFIVRSTGVKEKENITDYKITYYSGMEEGNHFTEIVVDHPLVMGDPVRRMQGAIQEGDLSYVQQLLDQHPEWLVSTW